MSLTVLFDLDDTLLHTNTHAFLPEYFKALGQAFSHLAPPKKLTQQIHHAVQLMVENQDPERMLSEIFAENFYVPLGTSLRECQDLIHSFYKTEYPKLEPLTQTKSSAPALIEWCQSQDMTLAIATNPLFPNIATRQRVEWAGLYPEDFAFISTFDDFHFTKPNLAYYAECLGRLGWPETQTVMIGDSLTHDLLPMEHFGFKTFWVDPPVGETNREHGALSAAKTLLRDLTDKKNTLRKENPDVQMAILRATPAVFDTWLKQYPLEALGFKPEKNEWNMTKILWHLAYTEQTICQAQWDQLLSNPGAMIKAVNPSTQNVPHTTPKKDPKTAFTGFLKARKISLEMIEELWEKGWFEIKVPHETLKETTVRELVAFSAKHDRVHLHQCFNLLNIYKIY